MYNFAFQLSVFVAALSQFAVSKTHLFYHTNEPRVTGAADLKSDISSVADTETDDGEQSKIQEKSDALQHNTPSFRSFQRNYLIIYLLAVSADWLQGPYVYALYSYYGYHKRNIAQLYIAGFASSAIFGTFVASLADKFGRRNNAVIYCITYILSCATKHSSDFYVLFLGRILGGIAYSILFATFEAWMVDEHRRRAYHPSLLAVTFARAQFGNGIVAILSGQLAGYAAHSYGKVSPFDLSIVTLIVLSVLLMTNCQENYGDAKMPLRSAFVRAFHTLISDKKILLLGIAQAAFEGAMYTFTFVWTPALQTASGQLTEIPHGTIFSTFMACTMIGSNIFAMLSSRASIRVETVMKGVFIIGIILFITATVSTHVNITYLAFLCFEILCGIYFPGMATVRAPYIPEHSRSSLLTFFRVPLNIIVVIALYKDLDVTSVFALCAVLMITAALSMHILITYTKKESDSHALSDNEDVTTEEEGATSDARDRC